MMISPTKAFRLIIICLFFFWLLPIIGLGICQFLLHRNKGKMNELRLERREAQQPNHVPEQMHAIQQSSAVWAEWSHTLGISAIGISSGLIISIVWLVVVVRKLQMHLQRLGYEELKLMDAMILHVAANRFAYQIPPATDILTIPGYGATPDQMVQFLRDQRLIKTGR